MIRHIVAEGQTLGQLAERYGVSLTELSELNGLDPGQQLPEGTMLWLPGGDPAGLAEPRRAVGEAVLRVPPDLFVALDALQDGRGLVPLRITKAGKSESLSLTLP